MNARGADGVTIPARLTVRELSEAVGIAVEELEAGLRARGRLEGPDDHISGPLAAELAKTAGMDVSVEPRDLALEYLYSLESVGEVGDIPAGRAGVLIRSVSASKDALDSSIEEAAEHWSVARMPVVDRNILRIGLHELKSEPGIPTAVIVSEAVRLAQRYSTERSSSFVNGVLATLAKTTRG